MFGSRHRHSEARKQKSISTGKETEVQHGSMVNNENSSKTIAKIHLSDMLSKLYHDLHTKEREIGYIV